MAPQESVRLPGGESDFLLEPLEIGDFLAGGILFRQGLLDPGSNALDRVANQVRATLLVQSAQVMGSNLLKGTLTEVSPRAVMEEGIDLITRNAAVVGRAL